MKVEMMAVNLAAMTVGKMVDYLVVMLVVVRVVRLVAWLAGYWVA
jgi:hypothetical protein